MFSLDYTSNLTATHAARADRVLCSLGVSRAYVSREGCIQIPAATENTQENVLALRAMWEPWRK
jgi:hypothetical protein